MKKLIIITMLVCAFAIVNNAQDLKYGVKGSFLVNNITVENQGYSTFKPGYSIGAFVQYDLLDNLGVSFEPVYAIKGANNIDPLIIYSQTSPLLWNSATETPIEYKSHDLSYSVIEMPILAQFKLEMGSMGLRVFVGPTMDFILNATHHYVIEDETLPSDFSRDIELAADVTDRFAYYDFGVIGGVGFDIEADPIDIRVDLKYRYGLTNLNKVSNKPAIYGHSIGLSVGVGINKFFE